VNEELLAEARRAQERLIDAERDADVARAEFYRAVRRLHLHGSSLRELAASLGLSHQRVHQIVEEAGGSRRWVRAGTRYRRPAPLLLACSFCGKRQNEVRKLIAGPGVYICDPCIALAGSVLGTGDPAGTELGMMNALPAHAMHLKCSFCGKDRRQTAGLVVMPAVTLERTSASAAVCSECLELCNEIVAEELGASGDA
jgi:hypothetical protein